METVGYIAAMLTTISFLPQAIKVIKTKDTYSISLHMYIIFISGVISWLIYGVFLENVPMILANAITSIFAGVILYYKIHEILTYKKHD
ncbi:MAG: SemiSWEET transporter [Bacteroidales bacterium]